MPETPLCNKNTENVVPKLAGKVFEAQARHGNLQPFREGLRLLFGSSGQSVGHDNVIVSLIPG